MTLASAIYEGEVRHDRRAPVPHAFRFPLFMLYLDLDEIDRVFRGRWLWSARRAAVARFHRTDHLGDPRSPLPAVIRDLVEARGGTRPSGPIRLLTQLRYFGYVFNPVSFYYCFGRNGGGVESIVAEVTNTPWNERHVYVLHRDVSGAGRSPQSREFETPKTFHVSPFMGMDVRHHWTFEEPGDALRVRIENEDGGTGARFFAAELDLRRREISGSALARALVRYPVMTAQVIAGIYWQALRLRRKGVPVHPHPRDLESETPAEVTA